MTPRLIELLDLVARWVHVIAGIMWIGNSLLFNWLDRILEPSTREGSREGMQGETWLLHSGGFYFVEKTQLAGQPLPRVLHWFKWQAYTTWLSGAALLVVVYYAGGRALLVDPAVAAISHGAAVAIAAGSLVAVWIVYDLIWRLVAPRSAAAAGALSIAGLVALVVALTETLSGRAAFLHVGAALGTIMAANVGHVIIPSQRALVTSVSGGRAETELGDRAKTRSIHNNYLTFPVIALMLSAHFPSFFGSPVRAVLLLAIIAAGAAVRHLMNVRFTYARWKPALAATVLVAAAGMYALLVRPPVRAATHPTAVVPREATFEEVRSIIDRRCTTCHSQAPSDLSFGPAPAGVSFDSADQISALMGRIRERAVLTRTMPPGNVTRMTERERAVLGEWAITQ